MNMTERLEQIEVDLRDVYGKLILVRWYLVNVENNEIAASTRQAITYAEMAIMQAIKLQEIDKLDQELKKKGLIH